MIRAISLGVLLVLAGCGEDGVGPASALSDSASAPSAAEPWLSGSITDGAASTQSIGPEPGSYDFDEYDDNDPWGI